MSQPVPTKTLLVSGRGFMEAPDGQFGEIWCSRPGIAELKPSDQPGFASLELKPWLNPETDWVLVETIVAFTCDPHSTYEIVDGKLPTGFSSANQLVCWLTTYRAVISAHPTRLS